MIKFWVTSINFGSRLVETQLFVPITFLYFRQQQTIFSIQIPIRHADGQLWHKEWVDIWQSVVREHHGPALIKPDQLDPCIKISWKSISCLWLCPYSFEILWHVIGLVPSTCHKIRNCRDKIVDSTAFPSWSLIHGSTWSGLIKVEVRVALNSFYHFIIYRNPNISNGVWP